MEEHVIKHGCSRDSGHAKPLHLRTGEVQHHEGDGSTHHRRAEIRFFQDERDEQQTWQHCRQQRLTHVFDVLHTVLQEPREEEDDRRLGQFRRLQREAADLDPAMRIMRTMHGERCEQHDHGYSDRRKHDIWPIEIAVVDAHQYGHGDEAEHRPARFARDEIIWRVIAFAGHDGGGTEDRGQPDKHQQQHDAVEPFVNADALRHRLLPLCRELSC